PGPAAVPGLRPPGHRRRGGRRHPHRDQGRTGGIPVTNDLAELKRFVVAHAISQDLPADHFAAVLDRIITDTADEPGSWPYEWIRVGRELEEAGQSLAAAQYYNFGRFPF